MTAQATKTRRVPPLWAAACGVGAVWLVGCATLGDESLFLVRDADETYQHLVAASPYGAAPDEDVLALSAEALGIAADVARRYGTNAQRLNALARLFIIGRDTGLGLHYDALGTYTATETLELRAGNCLAFTHLFIAMAREIGLDARYREAFGVSGWDQQGEFVLLNRHVGAYGEIPRYGTYQADFGILDADDDRFGGVIADDRARAQHFNNLGARKLTEHESAAAIRYFNRALMIDRDLSYVWGNLGTAYARIDEPELAELAYRQALRVNVYDATAVNQLTRLYDDLGAPELADIYRARGAQMARQNPYRQFQDGIEAIDAGDLDRAVNLLRRATRTQPDEFHFHLQYGRALALRGNDRRARTQLIRAADLAERPEQERAMLEILEELEQLVAAAPQRSERSGPFADRFDATLPDTFR